MTSESTPAFRFQFRLADLLLLVVLDGVLCAFVLPYFYRGFVTDPGLPYPSVGTISNRVPLSVLTVGTAAFVAGVVLMMLAGYYLKLRRWIQIGAAAIVGLIGGAAAPASPYNPWRASDRVEERAAIEACKAYCNAQDIYRRTDCNKDGVLEFAQTFGGPFGLCAPNIKLLDQSIADAVWGEGHPSIPHQGYIFKILTAQGKNASGGARPYLVNGGVGRTRMVMGYAMVASPAMYGGRTKKSYLVSNAGTIYEEDYGTDTPDVFKAMTEFNPTKPTWTNGE